MTELLVRTALADFDETQSGEQRDDFTRLENRDGRHSVDDDRLGADEFAHQSWLAVIE